ncbi:MAG TPA: TolC family protein [Gemmatimonadaceae bacterium]|nr:TolC family protein [Gemmatimonadaceae bacterium]
MRLRPLALTLLLPLFAPLAVRAQGTPPVAPAPFPPPPADSARPITLAEAVQLAQRNAPATVQARGALRTTGAAVRSAYAAFIPTLNINASTVQQSPATARVNPTTNEITSGRWSLTEGFSSSVDLFDGFRRVYDVRSAKAQVNAAESSELAQRYQVQLQVSQQYYAALAAAEAESAALAQLSQAEQQLRVTAAKVRARAATTSDSLRSRIQLGSAQLALLSARNDRLAADAALTRLVATPFTVTASPQDSAATFRPVEVDSASLARLAAEGPLVQQAQGNADAARAASRAARAPYLPTLSVGYSRNRAASQAQFDLFPNDYNSSGSLRFSLSYPLFNQYQREEGIVRADVAQTNADAALRDARLAAQQSLTQYLGALRTAEAQIAIQAATVTAAEEDLRVQQQRYELGASTLLDVLTSQTQLTQARVALILARFNARVAKAQLDALVGRTL